MTSVVRLRVVIGCVCMLVAGLGFWKLLTTPMDALVIGVTIGIGLWLSLWAYVGLALSALLRAIFGRAIDTRSSPTVQ